MRRWALLLLILAVIGGVTWVYLAKVLLIHRLRGELAAREREERALRERREKLISLWERRDDPRTLEEWIRKVLHWGYPGEVRVVFVR
ncbi:MAG TPA: hypothetical protein ENF77_02695 [Candidatus Acetothermia bacterium]|nr:hypothetical protein [Candidatus Bipolaricaulota bacterium]HDI11215.1 hypothetical protein [Candidatus Acetothermia bacterium]